MTDFDMTPRAISQRLELLRECSLRLRRPRSVDMSPTAVERRLRALGNLHRACLVLVQAGRRARAR